MTALTPRARLGLYGTVAHELFHLVQFSYFSRAEEPSIPSWVLEGSAAAMEGRVYPELDDKLVGICHYIFHRSTTRIQPVCYLNDLLTAPEVRGQGIGRALIERVYDIAREAGCPRVYWLTHTTNTPGRTLYDKVAKNFGFIQYAQDV